MSKKLKIVFRLDEVLKQKERGIREFARTTGIGLATISRIVHNKTRGISFDVLERICEELDIEPHEIYTVLKLKK